ncbi:MAG: tRNA 2-thiouridine(34) synthase MnmA [Deltaproteobacteria bacterium]|nr:tRNA 2-thiouridine(34) synthase MnmA [Deltaproteobacteria bacterium]
MKKEKVVVAMSGGVDSSLAAFLIKSQGYDTIGITLKLCSQKNNPASSERKSPEGVEYAAEMARKIDIPHYLFDLQKEFEQEVIEGFCREYISGRTPNPCIFCNEKIKLGALVRRAREMGADYVATGHYARVIYDKKKGRFLLKKGRDLQKDQSYFLFSLGQDQLKSVFFPLGGLTKNEVKQQAEKYGLSVSGRTESQEICFVPDNDYPAFIKSRFPVIERKGPVVSTRGEVLGEHHGVFSFTIGQRRGLNIARGYPLYVVALENDTNTVVVGEKEDLYRRELIASGTRWIAIESLNKPLVLKARIRYRHQECPALVVPLSAEKVRVEFSEPQRAITPGQAVVFYDGNIVAGGGWIE